MTHVIRVPIRATAVIRIRGVLNQDTLDETLTGKIKNEKCVFLPSHPILSEKQVVQVCDECGSELFEDEGKEQEVCDGCYQRLQAEARAERIHADDR